MSVQHCHRVMFPCQLFLLPPFQPTSHTFNLLNRLPTFPPANITTVTCRWVLVYSVPLCNICHFIKSHRPITIISLGFQLSLEPSSSLSRDPKRTDDQRKPVTSSAALPSRGLCTDIPHLASRPGSKPSTSAQARGHCERVDRHRFFFSTTESTPCHPTFITKTPTECSRTRRTYHRHRLATVLDARHRFLDRRLAHLSLSLLDSQPLLLSTFT